MLTSKGQNMTKRKRAEREAAILKQREEEVLENSEERQQERAQQYFKLLSKDASSSDEQDGSEGYDRPLKSVPAPPLASLAPPLPRYQSREASPQKHLFQPEVPS